MIADRALPSAGFAERVVLGACLVQPQAIPEAREAIGPDDFETERHRALWRLLCSMADAGLTISRVSVAERAMLEGTLETLGGVSWLVELDAGALEVADLARYCASVRSAATRRRVIHAAAAVAERAYDDCDAASALEYADATFTGLATGQAHRDWARYSEVIDAAGGLDAYLSARKSPGISSPWARLNSVLVDLQPGDLCILAARTGTGKTTFALQWAHHAAQQHHGVAVYSLEMSRQQLTDRAISSLGQVNSYAIRRSNADRSDRAAIVAGATLAVELPVYLCDSSDLDITALRNGVRRLQQRHGVGLVIVDYLQLLEGRGRSRYEQVSGIARSLKNAAMALGVPILALSQFSRAADDGEPTVSHLRDSGEIEQAANQILLLHGQWSYESDPAQWLPLELIVGKNRGGDAHLKIPMEWRKDVGLFRDAPGK